ncbi:MAG: hypothetical protein LBQ58_09995 [Synergistaceae bacterium]|jgi:uncharacterized membrane protein|nr:hypothetical protein [Synergistaceae bacterium]
MTRNPVKKSSLKQEQVELQMQRQVTLFEGPLPDPETLQKYKTVYPESVKIIFDMAKGYQDHIIKMDREGVDAVKRDLWLSFILGIVGQIGVLCIAFLGVIFAYLQPELGEAGFVFSAIVCGYLIWWKTKGHKQKRKDE